MTRETIPVELAFIFVILAFVAGYSFRGRSFRKFVAR
jgi:hypothetical protein